MTDAQRTRGLVDRWPTALALVGSAGAIAVIALLDRDLEIFGPVVALPVDAAVSMTILVGLLWL